MRQDEAARRSLSVLIAVLGLVSVLLGLAQLMQGRESALRLFPVTNAEDSVGFFANRNHYAALLTALIPLTGAWLIGAFDQRRPTRITTIAACLIAYAALLLGLGMARSRAGLMLAVIAAIASLMLATKDRRRESRRSFRAMGVAASVGGLLVVYFAFSRLLGRFEADIFADLRLTIARVTGGAVADFFPVGSGFGTFEAVYRMYEPREALMQTYVNHAHNDWLELLLEGGAPAAIIAVAFLIWFVLRSIRLWRGRHDGAGIDLLLVRAATISVFLVLIFSFIDYPLRTTTMSVLFAWCAALMTSPAPSTIGERAVDAKTHAEATTRRRSGHRPRRAMARRSFS